MSQDYSLYFKTLHINWKCYYKIEDQQLVSTYTDKVIFWICYLKSDLLVKHKFLDCRLHEHYENILYVFQENISCNTTQ